MASSSSIFWKTLGLGVVAGMRSMSAPAMVLGALHQHPSRRLAHSRWNWLQHAAAAGSLKLLAGAEMVGDKLPTTPSRTEPISVVGRTLSGAGVGALLYKLNRQPLLRGAMVGGLAAVAGTFGAYALRKLAAEKGGLPEPLPGVVEDVLVLAGGNALLAGYRARQ